ncbi:AraC family transcriptional regulator [Aminobacter sp. MDW-2]|uniref:helix-turn-helix transcriptional regulator n=1 Tax=Aminobacter sp. MDW-2 TaxID=2666139 RepID=UPI0012AFE291|nr:AraC family transcriptional regulator [Aminobacter sp. MDW-2]MRX37232.1 helix-turn-helix domain-containing protein [Aminobacter sp. MDW-2]QNH33242.1 helix-turn-helix transcriptional regulator [Aminobacter sp. MDW-2]
MSSPFRPAAAGRRRNNDVAKRRWLLSLGRKGGVLQFIDANLHRPDLDLALLMQQFRVSRAHLCRMFAGDGGVRAVIRDRRLNAAYRQLLSHQGKTGSITSIAHRLGFSSSNQFLRAFREQFGVTPSEVRHEGIASGERGLQAHLRKVKR